MATTRTDPLACEVWWVATGGDVVSRLPGLLDDVERNRLATIRRPDDRERFLLGAALTRAVLARRLSVPPAALPVDRTCHRCGGAHGKPRLAVPGTGIEVSVAHSGRLVGVAVCDGAAVGLDVEVLQPGAADDAPRWVLAPGEQEALARYVAAGGDALLGFLRLWTRKEAVVKMAGVGIQADLARVEVTGPADDAALRAWDGGDGKGVALRDLEVPQDGHVAALAVMAPAVTVTLRDGASILVQGAPV